MYTVYSVLLSPLWLLSVPGWPAISVSTFQQSRVWQIVWFGSLSAISQLASRVGEGGGVRHLCLYSVTQPFTTWPRWREQGRGLRSLPLHPAQKMFIKIPYFWMAGEGEGGFRLLQLTSCVCCQSSVACSVSTRKIMFRDMQSADSKLYTMDQISVNTPSPKCQLFLKTDQ